MCKRLLFLVFFALTGAVPSFAQEARGLGGDLIPQVCARVEAVTRCDADGAAYNDDCAFEDGRPIGEDVYLLSSGGGVVSGERVSTIVKWGSLRMRSCFTGSPGTPCCFVTENANLLCGFGEDADGNPVAPPAGTYRIRVDDLTDNTRFGPTENLLNCYGIVTTIAN